MSFSMSCRCPTAVLSTLKSWRDGKMQTSSLRLETSIPTWTGADRIDSQGVCSGLANASVTRERIGSAQSTVRTSDPQPPTIWLCDGLGWTQAHSIGRRPRGSGRSIHSRGGFSQSLVWYFGNIQGAEDAEKTIRIGFRLLGALYRLCGESLFRRPEK